MGGQQLANLCEGRDVEYFSTNIRRNTAGRHNTPQQQLNQHFFRAKGIARFHDPDIKASVLRRGCELIGIEMVERM